MVLAIVAGVLWGTNVVAVRWGLDRTNAPPLVAAGVGLAIGAVVSAIIAIVTARAVPSGGDAARFAVLGAITPGTSQGLFVAAIASIGPSRASILVGTSPVFSVLLAIAFVGESWQLVIVAGTILTVAGGTIVSWEPRVFAQRLGVAFALLTAFSFGVRDAVAREINIGSEVSPWWSASIVLGAATATVATIAVIRHGAETASAVRKALPEFLVSGLIIGLGLGTLLAALDQGRVGVVAPLSLGAQNTTVVIASAALFGARERAPRVVVGLLLVVLGAGLITAA